MSKRTAATEVYVEELTKVEQEILLLQHELEDAKNLNDDLAKKIDKKERELTKKDERLISLREKDAAELDLLYLEQQTEKEKLGHEVAFHESEMKLLSAGKQRMSDLVAENERLAAAITYLEEQLSRESTQHAVQTHEMNKSMLALRHQMETKLRRELTGLDISFQKEAFNALHERQKQAMFENAKLKDEVALQGVGIANLSARLAKQKILYNKCLKQLQFLNNKAEALREQLGTIALEKNNLAKQRELYETQMSNLRRDKERAIDALQKQTVDRNQAPAPTELYGGPVLSQSLLSLNADADKDRTLEALDADVAKHSSHHINELTNTLVDVAKTYSRENNKRHRGRSILSTSIGNTTQNLMDLASHYHQLLERMRTIRQVNQVWQRRYRYLQSVLLDLRPASKAEGKGQYSTALFPLFDMMLRLRGHLDSVQEFERQQNDGLCEGTGEEAAAETGVEDAGSRHSGSTQSLRLDELVPRLEWGELVSGDPDLQRLLEPFRGTEANYMSAMHSIAAQEFLEVYHHAHPADNDHAHQPRAGQGADEEKDQNMLAWALLKMFTAWHCPPEVPMVGGVVDTIALESLEEETDLCGPDEEGHAFQSEHRPAADRPCSSGQSAARKLKPWLQRPPSHHKNVFAAQIEQQTKSPYAHKTPKYVVNENDSVLTRTVQTKRINDIGEIGPPVMIRAAYNEAMENFPLAAAKSATTLSGRELAGPHATVSTISAQALQASADPLLRKPKFKSLRASGSEDLLHVSELKMSRKLLLGLRTHSAAKKILDP